MRKRKTNISKKEKIFPQNIKLELFSKLEQIIMNLTEENINLSAKHTIKLFDFNLPYSFNLVINNLIYYAFLSQRNKCTTYFKFLEIIQKKEEEKINSKYNIIEIFLNYIIKNNSQEALYLTEQMIRQNLIDANITKIIPSKYFAHYKTTTENKEWLCGDRFCSTFVKNYDQLSKNDFELHKKYVKKGHNPNEIAKIIRNDEIEKLQEITSQNDFDFNQTIEPSLYERCSFINQENVTLIDYAAFFSSVKCFKYLLMNEANVNNTGKYAIAGGNEEIVHLCEQNGSSFIGSYEIAIKSHRNDIFLYLYENKMDNLCEEHDTKPHKNYLKYEDLIKFCVMSGNYEILSFLEGEGTKINESIIKKSAEIGNIYLLMYFLHNNKKIPKNILIYSIKSENAEVVEYIILKHRKEINFNSVNIFVKFQCFHTIFDND